MFTGAVNEMLTWEVCCTRWGVGSSSPLRGFAIQTIDIFMRDCYLKYPEFLARSNMSHIHAGLGPPGSKYEDITKNLRRNVAL